MSDIRTKTISKLKYFLGKVCSIITTAMNRNFDEKISREHFVVVVRDVDADGIWGTHPYNEGVVSFFKMTQIISIHEEYVLDPSNPEDAQMIKEYEEKSGKTLKGDLLKNQSINKPLEIDQEPPSTPQSEAIFVDIESLEKIAEETRRAYESQEKLTK